MKRFFAKAACLFWSLGFLIFVLSVVIILFYMEEDWRGAHAWAATKAKWEARGVSFDPQTYIPPPIPDDQNLAAIPLFKQEPDPQYPAMLVPLTLRKAMRTHETGSDLPSTGSRQLGELPDMAKIKATIAKDYAEAFKNTPPLADTLAQLDALYPFLADLRAASEVHPLCRFQQDYAVPLPPARSLGLLTAQFRVSQILTLHAILALDDHQPDLALADLKTNFKLISGMRRDPTPLAGLVTIGMNAIGSTAIYNGLASHAWNDAQLAEIQDELARIDFLQNCQFVMQGEAVEETIPTINFLKKRGSFDIVGYFKRSSDFSSSHFVLWISSLWPTGWFDQNKAQAVEAFLNGAQTVDPKTHRIFPEPADDLENRAKASETRWDGTAPWNILFTESAPPVLSAPPKFAQGQVMLDETRIACALERYRLVHNTYPASLEDLAPSYITEIPHDIINGQPYHYQLRPDGTFLLYSVGWNQTDDGGKVVFKKDNPQSIDYKAGDWVWLTPQISSAK